MNHDQNDLFLCNKNTSSYFFPNSEKEYFLNSFVSPESC